VTVTEQQVEVAIVGGGIVSATLATMLAELQNDLRIAVFERLGLVAEESSKAMNNAGTGHAANCELNYTPEKADGTVAIAKALTINGAFEVSLQFWSHLVERGILPAEVPFLSRCPHLSFVWGEANTRFLRTRQARLSAHPMFQGMRISETGRNWPRGCPWSWKAAIRPRPWRPPGWTGARTWTSAASPALCSSPCRPAPASSSIPPTM